MPERIHIDQCPVDRIDHDQAISIFLHAIIKRTRRLCVAPVNAATVVEAHRNPQFCAALERLDVLLPDGFYLRPASRLACQPVAPHTPTVPLTLALLCALAARRGSVFLLGAQDEVVRTAAQNLVWRFPGLKIAGVHHGYFSRQEEPAIFREIEESGADVLLIGIGSPKREEIMLRWRDSLKVPVTIGVGGMLDILGGKTAEGPEWLRRAGLMWLYRFIQEPRRMWRRYTFDNAQFLKIVLRHALRVRQERRARARRAAVPAHTQALSLHSHERGD